MTRQRRPHTYDKCWETDTKEDNGTTTTSYTYNGLDQLKTSTKEKGTAVEEVRQYDYDANGNQTDVKNTKTGENQTYVYDARKQIKSGVRDKRWKDSAHPAEHSTMEKDNDPEDRWR